MKFPDFFFENPHFLLTLPYFYHFFVFPDFIDLVATLKNNFLIYQMQSMNKFSFKINKAKKI